MYECVSTASLVFVLPVVVSNIGGIYFI